MHHSYLLYRTKLAWSRLGCVASLSPDAISVYLRYLHFSQTERKWNLSKENPIDLSANGDSQHPFLQLEWSQSGADLALVDAAGRVTIVNISSTALNETAVVRPATLDREDELGQVLTMYWLNIDRHVSHGHVLLQDRVRGADQMAQYVTFMHASKDQGKWTYMASKRRPMGPFWPRGVLIITRKGMLALHYQRPDGPWAIASAGLRSLTSTGYLLTHAAIAPAQGLLSLSIL